MKIKKRELFNWTLLSFIYWEIFLISCIVIFLSCFYLIIGFCLWNFDWYIIAFRFILSFSIIALLNLFYINK